MADYYFYTGGGAADWLTPPSAPSAIAVPSGATLAIDDHGVGTQIYTCTASGGAGGAGGSGADAGATMYSWVLKGPDAVLSTRPSRRSGRTASVRFWSSSDGSVISGTKLAQASNTSASNAVALLLLKATSTGGAGVFANITYVQRLNTAGGVASGDCGASTVGTETSAAYSADYYFFTGGTGAGGAGGNGG